MRQSRNAESAETGFFGSISSFSIENLLPRSISSKQKSISNPKIPKSNAENTPPSDPNIQVCDEQSLPASTKQWQSKAPSSQIEVVESDASQDSPVKVVVRTRPHNNEGKEGDETIKKVSPDTLCIADRQFTFDLIFDSNSCQGFSSSKTSRITLTDLAGLNKNKIEDGDRLVDALTEETRFVKAAEITNRSSCLTRLPQESLGGNVKLSVICSISSDNKSNGKTLQTLEFGQRIRSIRNKPVINEIQEDGLSDQIRQLKEELIREKANVHNSTGRKNGYFQGLDVLESLNKLRVSLNRSLLLPHIDNDTDIKQLNKQINVFYGSCEIENP